MSSGCNKVMHSLDQAGLCLPKDTRLTKKAEAVLVPSMGWVCDASQPSLSSQPQRWHGAGLQEGGVLSTQRWQSCTFAFGTVWSWGLPPAMVHGADGLWSLSRVWALGHKETHQRSSGISDLCRHDGGGEVCAEESTQETVCLCLWRGLLTFDHLMSIFYMQMAADVPMKETIWSAWEPRQLKSLLWISWSIHLDHK